MKHVKGDTTRVAASPFPAPTAAEKAKRDAAKARMEADAKVKKAKEEADARVKKEKLDEIHSCSSAFSVSPTLGPGEAPAASTSAPR